MRKLAGFGSETQAPNASDRLITVGETADLLRVSTRKVFAMLAVGVMQRVKVGASTRIRLSEAMRIVEGGVK